MSTLQDAVLFCGGGHCREHEQLRSLAADCPTVDLGTDPFATLAAEFQDDLAFTKFCADLSALWQFSGGLRSPEFFELARANVMLHRSALPTGKDLLMTFGETNE